MHADPTAKRRARRLIVVMVLATVLVSACGDAKRETSGREGASAEAVLPQVTAKQAGEAISDAMLVTSQALYLAIATTSESREVAADGGALHMTWSEDADFLTGAGTYTITLDEYAIPPEDPFSQQYYGYVLTGSIVLASQTGEKTEVRFDLDTAHPDSEQFPAQTVDLELSGFRDGTDAQTRGSVSVNGHDFSFEDLAASF